MAEEPDRIRDDIEATRASLSRDVDQLADRTVPTRVAQRRWTSMKEKVRGVSDRVMGTSERTAGSVQDTARSAVDTAQDVAGNVADSVREAPQAVVRKARGNPVAVGIIAFGAGLLAASLIPATEVERRAGQQLKENASGLVEPLAESGRQLADDLSGSVREAVGQVKDTTKQAAQTTADEAKDSARDATQRARDAAR
jgi:uncharacterized protein YjbJ (UPF0337 family)